MCWERGDDKGGKKAAGPFSFKAPGQTAKKQLDERPDSGACAGGIDNSTLAGSAFSGDVLDVAREVMDGCCERRAHALFSSGVSVDKRDKDSTITLVFKATEGELRCT